MVNRIYVEKKDGFDIEAKGLKSEINSLLGIKNLCGLRIINRYDVENIDGELMAKCVNSVFSEPQLDNVAEKLDALGGYVFAVEYLPGQFDQRADSAGQCVQLISQQEKPLIRTAKVYILYGELTEGEIDSIKKYVINPVESRLASLEEYKTLSVNYSIPTTVERLDGFNRYPKEELQNFVSAYGLAMDLDDITFCQEYFVSEKRDPTITEIRMIDTYWSDHCRHTTFLTTIDKATFTDKLLQETYEEYLSVRKAIGRTKPINLMDIATVITKYHIKNGYLPKIDVSEEINACTVKIKVDVDGEEQDWLLLFKNETHNHPTEIEPFGGAATCIGGAIRDPLSGRAYVYSAMRVTGAGDPTVAVKDTIKGKLSQRKIVTTASAGYSSYGNQIGLATGQVDEIYHSGYVAKRMEIGAVVGAVPEKNVRRECPKDGDIVILLGGRTGRDGCGGATGSSKKHTLKSLSSCGAEVQKGNAPEERKLQRLFRNSEASLLIKRCNDFGAGGVSVAIGELADGIEIDLNAVPKKYDGLDGTELAISESQERMAVVVEAKDAKRFMEIANSENLEASVVAVVKDSPRLVMKWNGVEIVNISREFLNSNGAEKHIEIAPKDTCDYAKKVEGDFVKNYKELAGDLNVCSKRGLTERFDSTVGAGTVLMPFGGKYQLTPAQAMANKVSVELGHTDTCSLMAWGYNPFISSLSPYHGAYLAVIESVSKLIATGAKFEDVYLTFQEYFEKPLKDAQRWGKPLSALLGAFKAQKELHISAIGGKDSMSGSFEDIDVPPTLVSFAVTCEKVNNIVSNDFKLPFSKVVFIPTAYDKRTKLPETNSLLSNFRLVNELLTTKKAISCYTPTYGGIAEGVMKMCFGNKLGFKYADNIGTETLFGYNYGGFILELAEDIDVGIELGRTTADRDIVYKGQKITLDELLELYEGKLESIYPTKTAKKGEATTFSYVTVDRKTSDIQVAKPKMLIPVFPGTNCEFDTAKRINACGGEGEIFVINNLNSEGVKRSVVEFAKKIASSQIVFIPGGFSGGDEPDGSGKFITAFFRNEVIKEAVNELLYKRDGLMGGICNGFQALIKLGLVPYGKITDTDADSPTLTFNDIGRHQSRLVRTRIASNKSPWFMLTEVGEVYTVPISHGEGKFVASEQIIKELADNGQIVSQYVDFDNKATYDIDYNPNGSVQAIEGITSPDGRVFGKMGHSERYDNGLYKNFIGNFDIKLFQSAVKYFK